MLCREFKHTRRYIIKSIPAGKYFESEQTTIKKWRYRKSERGKENGDAGPPKELLQHDPGFDNHTDDSAVTVNGDHGIDRV